MMLIIYPLMLIIFPLMLIIFHKTIMQISTDAVNTYHKYVIISGDPLVITI